jgi:hypothetical protein
MKFETAKYKSVDLYPHTLKQFIENYVPGDAYGFILISNQLVPYSFLERLFDEMMDCNYEYGEVVAIEELFSSDFFESLTENEQEILGPCVLIIFENGLAIPIPENTWHKH